MINWSGVLGDINIILITYLFINSINAFNNGFNWISFGVLFSGLSLVFLLVILRNFEEKQQ